MNKYKAFQNVYVSVRHRFMRITFADTRIKFFKAQ